MQSESTTTSFPKAFTAGRQALSKQLLFFMLVLYGFFCPISIGAAQAFAALAFMTWIVGLHRQGLK